MTTATTTGGAQRTILQWSVMKSVEHRVISNKYSTSGKGVEMGTLGATAFCEGVSPLPPEWQAHAPGCTQ
jgi:hypothetical protein